MWLVVASEHLPAAAKALTEHWAKDLPDGVDASEVTIDLDADEAACPACGASFDAGRAHCPDCGLRVG